MARGNLARVSEEQQQQQKVRCGTYGRDTLGALSMGLIIEYFIKKNLKPRVFILHQELLRALGQNV